MDPFSLIVICAIIGSLMFLAGSWWSSTRLDAKYQDLEAHKLDFDVMRANWEQHRIAQAGKINRRLQTIEDREEDLAAKERRLNDWEKQNRERAAALSRMEDYGVPPNEAVLINRDSFGNPIPIDNTREGVRQLNADRERQITRSRAERARGVPAMTDQDHTALVNRPHVPEAIMRMPRTNVADMIRADDAQRQQATAAVVASGAIGMVTGMALGQTFGVGAPSAAHAMVQEEDAAKPRDGYIGGVDPGRGEDRSSTYEAPSVDTSSPSDSGGSAGGGE